jgi:lipopolysaccharide exporter
MHDINQRMAKGIVWMVGARLMDRSIGIISTLILARLLVPGDFGLVAMATAIGGILDLFGAFSFDLALIQKANADHRHYNTVWTFNFIFGATCGLVLMALAIPAATFYSEPRLTNVMYVLSLSYFINIFSNIGVINFRKNLEFGNEFLIIFIRRLTTFAITITSAYILRSYWALLIGMTAGRIVGVGLSYTMNSYRPAFTLSAARELFSFSKWLLINNALGFLQHNGCTFVIGRLFGVTELGIYSVSYEISSLPSTELVAPINRATFPGFSKMKNTGEIASSYLKLFGMITLIIVPVGIGIAVVAEPLVLTALGTKWISAIPLIQILAIHGAISATQGNNGPVWLSLGKPREMTVWVFIFLLILFPSLYFFMHQFGIKGAGYAYLSANLLTLPYAMMIMRRHLGFKWQQLLQVIWCPALAASLMYFGVRQLDITLHNQFALVRLISESVVGAVIYTITILTLWQVRGRPNGPELYCLEKLIYAFHSVQGKFRKNSSSTGQTLP